MGSYLLGLLTLPAIVGALAAAYGIYRAGGWLLDHSPIVRMQFATPKQRAMAGAAMASVRTVWAFRFSELVGVWISFGRVDTEIFAKHHKALAPHAPAPKLKTEWLGEQ